MRLFCHAAMTINILSKIICVSSPNIDVVNRRCDTGTRFVPDETFWCRHYYQVLAYNDHGNGGDTERPCSEQSE